jgi:hypothetical protein
MLSTIQDKSRTSTQLGIAVLALTVIWAVGSAARESGTVSAKDSANADLPLSFEPNQGQSEDGVQFVARGPGYVLYLDKEGSSFQVSSATISGGRREPLFAIKLAGEKKSTADMFGLDEQPSKSSYFTGSDPKKWHTGIPNFRRVARLGVYQGIDLTYRGSQGQLECDFKVAPHANPGAIVLEVVGARELRRDARGDVVFTVANIEMRLHRPDAYQEMNGASRAIASHYLVKGNLITLLVGTYDPGKILYINPILSYSGFLKQDATAFPTKGPHNQEPLEKKS